jgi:hypothetical protein
MGIIVTDSFTFNTGITLDEYYVNIADIHISKTQIENPKYGLLVNANFYISKTARDQGITEFRQMKIDTHVNDFVDVYEHVYTKLKTYFENYTDVFEVQHENIVESP